MYCGAGTKTGKAIWALFCCLLLPALIAWIVFFIVANMCQNDREDAGCSDDDLVNVTTDEGNVCDHTSCTVSTALFWIAAGLILLSAIPCCMCCCCSKPPSKKTTSGDLATAGKTNTSSPRSSHHSGALYNQTGRHTAQTGSGQYSTTTSSTTPYTGTDQQTGSAQYSSATPYVGTGQRSGTRSAENSDQPAYIVQPIEGTGQYHVQPATGIQAAAQKI